jgi:hypothetical protein
MNYEEFKAELKHRSRRDLMHPQERCPGPETLVRYVTNELDEATRSHVGVHLAFCKDCSLELSAFENLERPATLRKLIDNLKSFTIDFTRTYGPGAMLGSARIVAENAALAMRGSEAVSSRVFKVVELSIGGNTYSIEIGLTADGAVSCDIAGATTPRLVPLTITVHSENGQELFTIESDVYGTAQFVLDRMAEGLFVITLDLEGAKDYILFFVPAQTGPLHK